MTRWASNPCGGYELSLADFVQTKGLERDRRILSRFDRLEAGSASFRRRVAFLLLLPRSLESGVHSRLYFRIDDPHGFRSYGRRLVKEFLGRLRRIESGQRGDLWLGKVPLVNRNHVVEHFVDGKALDQILRLSVHAREFLGINIWVPLLKFFAIHTPHLRKQLLQHLRHLRTARHDVEEFLDILFGSRVGRGGNGGLCAGAQG